MNHGHGWDTAPLGLPDLPGVMYLGRDQLSYCYESIGALVAALLKRCGPVLSSDNPSKMTIGFYEPGSGKLHFVWISRLKCPSAHFDGGEDTTPVDKVALLDRLGMSESEWFDAIKSPQGRRLIAARLSE